MTTADMTDRIPAEAFPLGVYIREEMDERGWGINDVVARMGGDPVINELCLRLTIEIDDPNIILDETTAAGLSKALGPSKEYFLNLDRAYREATLRQRKSP